MEVLIVRTNAKLNFKNYENENEVENIRLSRIKALSSKTDYMDWLSDFSISNPYINDDNVLEDYKSFSEDDKRQVCDLNILYSAIDKYAKDNLMSPEKCDNGYYYNVKYNDNYFEIGYLMSISLAFFSKKSEYDENKNYIDFMNIVNDCKLPETDALKESLNALVEHAKYLMDEGVSLDIINEALANLYDNKDKTRVLKRN